MATTRKARFSIGAGVAVEELAEDPHPHLARLRDREPVWWLPAIGGWLVTRRDLGVRVMRDTGRLYRRLIRASLTGRLVGRSMLTIDDVEHSRDRDPFAFRRDAVQKRFTAIVAAEVDRLRDAIEPMGRSFAVGFWSARGPVSSRRCSASSKSIRR
jgi:hypothetical protein